MQPIFRVHEFITFWYINQKRTKEKNAFMLQGIIRYCTRHSKSIPHITIARL